MIEKTLHNSDVSGAKKNVKDIQIVGNGDMFQLLCKASSQDEGWMKSTKAMQLVNGCLVQVTTQQRNPDGSYAVSEALTFAPDVVVVDDENNGRRLEGVLVTVGSTEDERTANNAMRHEYPVLDEVENVEMRDIKDAGLMFHALIDQIGDSRELSLAKTKVEEAVMWAVKHVTR